MLLCACAWQALILVRTHGKQVLLVTVRSQQAVPVLALIMLTICGGRRSCKLCEKAGKSKNHA